MIQKVGDMWSNLLRGRVSTNIYHSGKQPAQLRALASQLLRAVVIFLLCLVASLFSLYASQAAFFPSGNRLQNPDFETGSFFPWFRDGNAQWVGVEGCCAQHRTFYWPNPLFGTDDTWDGYIWNENRSRLEYGALAQSPSISAGQRYRLSAWLSTSHGNLVRLRRYANGVTSECASTTAVWPSYVNKSCEFAPASDIFFNVHMSGNVTKTQWIVSDDWALTALVQVPQSPSHPKQSVFPVTYFALNYHSSTDRAANNWNAAVNRTPAVFAKATSEASARIVINAVDNGFNGIPAQTVPQANGQELITLNIWYFSQWSSDAKVSTIAHELGHALGLGHVFNECQIMYNEAITYFYCGLTGPTTGSISPVTGDVNSLKALYGWP